MLTLPYNMNETAKILAPSAVPMTNTKMYTVQSGDQPIPLAKAMTNEQVQEAIVNKLITKRIPTKLIPLNQ